MAEEIKNEEIAEEEMTAQDAEQGSDNPEKPDALTEKLEQTVAELAAANDKYLRLAAEYDNFRKRSAKERESVYADAYADALCALLPIFDNLERAVKYADGDSLQQGVALTLKGLTATLEKLGITEIEAEGKPFDPNFHNAVMHVEDDTLGEGVVAEVLQKGYCRGERVLRYAMVKVAN